jgi:hypothetical protein
MTLLRFLFFLLICYIILAAVKALLGARKKKPGGRETVDSDGEEMVLDPQCHSYVAKTDAVLKSGQYFCSHECARLYLTR